MMTLRTLKKKSKQAAAILVKHFPNHRGKIFKAQRGDSYHGFKIRCGCPQREGWGCECQWHPLKGTPMVGAMSDYYEPEWMEHTALEELQEFVLWGGGKPETMTDDEWRRTLRITGASPMTDDDLREM